LDHQNNNVEHVDDAKNVNILATSPMNVLYNYFDDSIGIIFLSI